MKRQRTGSPKDGWYLIEPIDAQSLLDGQHGNRPLTVGKAVRFAKMMSDGDWRPNGEPLILDENGSLLDGQGRCRACVLAGVPFETYVVHGVPRRFFSSMDTGQIRTGAHTLAVKGVKLYSSIAGAARLDILKYPFAGKVENLTLESYYRSHKGELEGAVDDLRGIDVTSLSGSKGKNGALLPPSILLYLMIGMSRVDRADAVKFMRMLLCGDEIPAGSPVLILKERLTALIGERHKMLKQTKIGLAIKAWNLYRSGWRAKPNDRRRATIRFVAGEGDFPAFDGTNEGPESQPRQDEDRT